MVVSNHRIIYVTRNDMFGSWSVSEIKENANGFLHNLNYIRFFNILGAMDLFVV